jgi:hypothetical protein
VLANTAPKIARQPLGLLSKPERETATNLKEGSQHRVL